MLSIFLRLRLPLFTTFAGLPAGTQRPLLISVFAGIAAGASSAVLLAFINSTLADAEHAGTEAAAFFFGLCLLMLFAGTFSDILVTRLTQNIIYDLRIWLSRRILSIPLEQLQTHGPHRLMAALTEDINSVANAYHMLPVLFIEGSMALGGIAYIAWLSWALFAILLGFLLAGLTVFFIAQRWTLRFMRRAREADDALFGHFRALTGGWKELKMDARRRHAFLNRELSPAASAIRSSLNSGLTIFALGAHSSKLLFFIAIGAVLFVPALSADGGMDSARSWTLSILFLMGPIETVVNTFPVLGQGLVALRKLYALAAAMAEEELMSDSRKALNLLQKPCILELTGVTYRYPSEGGEPGFAIGPIDLRIEPGELVFITGGNGNGKTTLALLILGLLVPAEGEIKLGGETVSGKQRDLYRQNFAAVFADAFVFSSILGYETPPFTEKAGKLLKSFQLSHKVTVTEGKFSTVDLSYGQRKRLALLSAFVEDRPFYVFDEWAAEQDPIFREIFYTSILAKLKSEGKTVIAITHDEQYYHIADRLLRFSGGRIEEAKDWKLQHSERNPARKAFAG
ncbi:MAG TPA: cyclic peptide export ABC transporter [Methylocella sp.]|nr:cyclic peptide export ABC transporter [Methylocella sp.]